MTTEAPRLRDYPKLAASAGLIAAVIFAGAGVGGLYLARMVSDRATFAPIYFQGPHVATSPVHLGQTVTVHATRCNKTKQPVVYQAIKAWVDIDDPGTQVPVGGTTATQTPGCTTSDFTNAMPSEVISITSGRLTSGRSQVRWEITAVNTPTGHKHAATTVWATNPIVVVK